jgi:hypothetical protein
MPLPLNREALRRYLARAISAVDVNRPPAPITLAGPRSNSSATPQHPPPLLSNGAPPPKDPWEHDGRTRPKVAEPEPGDEQGAYAHAELVRMDNRFRDRLLRAFERGLENRESASRLRNHSGE